jgi:cytoskeletal protein RodZ
MTFPLHRTKQHCNAPFEVYPEYRLRGGFVMRIHHVIAVVAVLIIGVGVKQFFSPAKTAEADIRAVSVNILQMHREYPNMKNLTLQHIKADLM